MSIHSHGQRSCDKRASALRRTELPDLDHHWFGLQLRLNKVSELIHNSTHHTNLEMAKVSVYFQEIIDTVLHDSMLASEQTCCFNQLHLRLAVSNLT